MSNYSLNPCYPYHRCFFIRALASSTADCRVKREKRSTGVEADNISGYCTYSRIAF